MEIRNTMTGHAATSTFSDKQFPPALGSIGMNGTSRLVRVTQQCLNPIPSYLVLVSFLLTNTICSRAIAQHHADEFHDNTLRIAPENTTKSILHDSPYIGTKRAFKGTARRIVHGQPKGYVQFDVSPNMSRDLIVSEGTDTVRYPANSWLTQQLHESAKIISGPVRKGTVLPLFGAIYVVSAIEDDPRGGHGVAITLRRLQTEQYPGDIELDPYAYAITQGGLLDIPSTLIQPEILVDFDTDRRCILTIRGEVNGTSHGKGRWDAHVTTRDVVASVGKLIVVRLGQNKVLFRVVTIVHPNEKERLIGWAEVRRVWPVIVPFGTSKKPN